NRDGTESIEEIRLVSLAGKGRGQAYAFDSVTSDADTARAAAGIALEDVDRVVIASGGHGWHDGESYVRNEIQQDRSMVSDAWLIAAEIERRFGRTIRVDVLDLRDPAELDEFRRLELQAIAGRGRVGTLRDHCFGARDRALTSPWAARGYWEFL